jgi:hypothetical protein
MWLDFTLVLVVVGSNCIANAIACSGPGVAPLDARRGCSRRSPRTLRQTLVSDKIVIYKFLPAKCARMAAQQLFHLDHRLLGVERSKKGREGK